MADDCREAGAPAPPEHLTRREPSDAAEQLHMPCAEDECEEVSPSDVLVHGRGSIEEVLEVLHDIARTCRERERVLLGTIHNNYEGSRFVSGLHITTLLSDHCLFPHTHLTEEHPTWRRLFLDSNERLAGWYP